MHRLCTRILIIATGLVLAACAPTRLVTIAEPFDSLEATRMLSRGNNTIHGSALIRQMGGGIVTCAGNPVTLIPATAYAKRRMAAMYGSRALGTERVEFQPNYSDYFELTRTTICNVTGHFTFEDLADGEFFVVTSVAWLAAYDRQGGNLMGRIAVAGGQRKELTLSPNTRVIQ